jgi:phosphoribosylformimino-5-aminoimidazole carboxamide ribotide isomerase
MELIPVLDLARGVAVHAQGGVRSEYGPVRSMLTPGHLGDALALARAYRKRIGARRCYVADLDAIVDGQLQRELILSLANPEEGFGAGLILDAGAAGISQAAAILELGVGEIVVGLESLRDFGELEALVREVGTGRVGFSLDLRSGMPVLQTSLARLLAPEVSAQELALRAIHSGAAWVLLLDLDDVGSRGGPSTLGLIGALAQATLAPLYAGGGVRGREDLDALSKAGARGALVGSWLHTSEEWRSGRIEE